MAELDDPAERSRWGHRPSAAQKPHGVIDFDCCLGERRADHFDLRAARCGAELAQQLRPERVRVRGVVLFAPEATRPARQHQRADLAAAVHQADSKMRRAGHEQLVHDSRVGRDTVGENDEFWIVLGDAAAQGSLACGSHQRSALFERAAQASRKRPRAVHMDTGRFLLVRRGEQTCDADVRDKLLCRFGLRALLLRRAAQLRRGAARFQEREQFQAAPLVERGGRPQAQA